MQKKDLKQDLKAKKKPKYDPLARAYLIVFGSGFTAMIVLVLSLIFQWATMAWISGILFVSMLMLLFDVPGYMERLFKK
jgi:hypothetical protein